MLRLLEQIGEPQFFVLVSAAWICASLRPRANIKVLVVAASCI
jgi:hypothetical protein